MQPFFSAVILAVIATAGCNYGESPPANPSIVTNATTNRYEESRMTGNWPFTDAENTAVIALTRIMNRSKPILYVVHDEDGDWQFLDGDDVADEDAATVALNRVASLDSTAETLADLPKGWVAERDAVDKPWRRFQR